MTAVSPFSRTSSVGVSRQPKRPTTNYEGEREAIWIPMLQSASKGKELTEKQLIVLGGSPDQQLEFLEQLNPTINNSARSRYSSQRKTKQAPISNKYALGYTYHDVLDADHEDVLARLNVSMLSNPSSVFVPLLKPLLTTKTVKDTLVTVLLDWDEPQKWARQFRQWIRLLRRVVVGLDEETKIEMEECMNAWKEKGVGPDAQTQSAEQKAAGLSPPPLGPGEWDEGLGLPLSVVCVRSEKIDQLEKEQGWQEDHFDFVMQWLRTVLLKHGGSLCLTASFDSNHVRTLIHSSLSIHSLLKRDIAKHNVIDRDKILVPPNWDSWGKIRILREGFEPEEISNKWSVEIQTAPETSLEFASPEGEPQSAIAVYEGSIPAAPELPSSSSTQHASSTEITTTVSPLQDFLQHQQSVLEKLYVEDEKNDRRFGIAPATIDDGSSPGKRAGANSRMTDQIGPHQINVNGIDFDAEEATRRLREREQERTADATTRESSGGRTPTRTKTTDATIEGKEAVSAFFANLMKKGQGGTRSGTGSGIVSPRRESPARDGKER